MKIALLQLNTTVGDLEGNAARIEQAAVQAFERGADLCVTPEMALMGYPPLDLLLNKAFVTRSWELLGELARLTSGHRTLLVGLAEPNPAPRGRELFNSAVLLRNGEPGQRFRKCLLPNYDVFDEERYFEPSREPGWFEYKGRRIGVTICEDVWNDKEFWRSRRYDFDPVQALASQQVDLVLNMSASPFVTGKHRVREAIFTGLAARNRVPVLYCNQVGGNDDLVFPGRSCAFDADGTLTARATPFAEDVLVVDLGSGGRIAPDSYTPEAEIWQALVLGTRDYVRKCGFKTVLLGLSGGIDSSLTAVLAAEAVGSHNVLGVLMPSPFTSRASIEDAQVLASGLGVKTLTMPIQPIFDSFLSALEEPFSGLPPDVTEENLQARIRGNLLMALSNKYGSILLTTGNKSELAVGYCTIYGDMSGGLAVLSDVPKTLVYRISRWLNRERGEVIPRRVLTKPPSAELRPNQTDQDILPPYEVLDEMLQLHLVEHLSGAELKARGFEPDTVDKVVHMVHLAEFKRKQSPPGIKITDRAFGTGWRMPIAKKLGF
ncbi:MAG: NAD+ synthase [Desulfohalobiaceae bacterium]